MLRQKILIGKIAKHPLNQIIEKVLAGVPLLKTQTEYLHLHWFAASPGGRAAAISRAEDSIKSHWYPQRNQQALRYPPNPGTTPWLMKTI
jgi:hypothetical protein